jgi:ribosome-associated heat shock protein Hsp15
MAQDRQRLDKWLFVARFFRTRALAAEAVGHGYVRVNGARTEKPGKDVAVGDVLTIALSRDVRVVRILGLAERRGGAADAQILYGDVIAET